MPALKDPVRDALILELRAFRKGSGEPTVDRLDGLFYLTEILGEGIPERAFEVMERLHRKLGADPESSIGAYCFLAGWGVGCDTVDQRRREYVARFHCDESTAWRRADRGIKALAARIRDQDESSRPWAMVSIFQSGNAFQPVLDFNLGYESWQPPQVLIDGQAVALDFHVHPVPGADEQFTRRIVLPESPLKLDVGFGEPMATLRVLWPMPVWPVWNVAAWTADPRIMTRLRTFRQRAVEVSLEWWRKTPASNVEGLVTDGAVWAERTDPNRLNLPAGWRVGASKGEARRNTDPSSPSGSR